MNITLYQENLIPDWKDEIGVWESGGTISKRSVRGMKITLTNVGGFKVKFFNDLSRKGVGRPTKYFDSIDPILKVIKSDSKRELKKDMLKRFF